MAGRRVNIVPHTHWDREWYEPFQSFRMRLVEMVDSLLDHLESDPSYRRFLLDGQLAMVDDYLEVRPEAEARIRELASSGRVSMGPWYALMDEFLVSGETIVRDLQMGMHRATAFGGAMEIGYLPDMFGHIAQMPQILALAGLEKAVVWRGVPEAIDRTGFWWSSPDGSTVRAEYLVCGYGNGAAIPDDAKALVRRIAAHEEEISELLTGDLLYMNGTDHQDPQPWLGRVVAEANSIQEDYELAITSLPEALEGAPTEDLPSWRGELRSGARANLLMGVGSNRVDTKQRAARAERALEREAEPLAALLTPPGAWPERLLELAWLGMVRNAAHDSVCACSLDEVVETVNHRYAEARHIAEGITERSLSAFAATLETREAVVLNPSARSRGGVVEVVVPGDEPVEGAQVIGRSGGTRDAMSLTRSEVHAILSQIREQKVGAHTYINAIELDEHDDAIHVRILADSEPLETTYVEEMKRELYAAIGRRPDTPVNLRFVRPVSQRLLMRTDAVPGYGWAPLSPAPLADPVGVDAGGLTMANGMATLQVDPDSGTFALDGLAGFDRLEDGGDAGDTYNYSPPDADTVVTRPESVSVRVLEPGPVRGRIEVVRVFRWPAALSGQERVGTAEVSVTTTLELRAGEPLVRVHTTFDNPCRDHRLRAILPLARAATVSEAECAFAVVERGLSAEGGPSERGLPTFPSRRFVRAGGLTVVHEGLLEYELVDIGEEGGARALALTLLRSTGWLSQVTMAYRPVAAGPHTELEGSQLVGPVEARYGVCVSGADPYALVDDAFLPLRIVRGRGRGSRGERGQALSVEGGEVSAVRREAGQLTVRVFNPSPVPESVRLRGRRGWTVDLRGRAVAPFEEAFELGPWAIATARLAGDTG